MAEMRKGFMMKKDSLVLATYNLRVPCDPPPYDWENRRDRVRKVVQDNGLDIYGVQEAVLFQLKDLLELETGNYAYIGGGRDDFRDAGEHSCILYRTDRLELLAGGTFSLSEQPDVPGIRAWDAACPRCATWGKFRDRLTGKEFCYCNTHLDHVGITARIKGIELVVSHAAENAAGLPMILSGDFNVKPDSETYRAAAALLRDSACISETGHTGADITFHGFGKAKNPCLIDYIFVSDGIRVLRHWTDATMPDGDYASDHHPVIAELQIG